MLITCNKRQHTAGCQFSPTFTPPCGTTSSREHLGLSKKPCMLQLLGSSAGGSCSWCTGIVAVNTLSGWQANSNSHLQRRESSRNSFKHC